MQNHTTKLKIKSSWKWMRVRVKKTIPTRRLVTSYSVKWRTQLSTKSMNAKFANVTAITFFFARKSIISFVSANASRGGILLPFGGTVHIGCFNTEYDAKWLSPFSPGFDCPPISCPPLFASVCSSLPAYSCFQRRSRRKKRGGRDNKVLSSNSTWLLVGSWVDLLKKTPPMSGKLKNEKFGPLWTEIGCSSLKVQPLPPSMHHKWEENF